MKKKTTRANCVGDGPARETMDTDIADRPKQSLGVQVGIGVVKRMDESTEWGTATAKWVGVLNGGKAFADWGGQRQEQDVVDGQTECSYGAEGMVLSKVIYAAETWCWCGCQKSKLEGGSAEACR